MLRTFWGGEVCTFFKFCLYGKTGLIFKPDIVRPDKRDWAVLSKDTPLDISI